MEKDLNIFKRRTCVLKYQMYLAISLDVYISKHIFVKHALYALHQTTFPWSILANRLQLLTMSTRNRSIIIKKMFSMFVFLERKFL